MLGEGASMRNAFGKLRRLKGDLANANCKPPKLKMTMVNAAGV